MLINWDYHVISCQKGTSFMFFGLVYTVSYQDFTVLYQDFIVYISRFILTYRDLDRVRKILKRMLKS